MQKWLIKSTDTNIHEYGKTIEEQILYRIIGNRQINSKKDLDNYLDPSLESMPDPLLMKDMDKASLRLAQAIENKESILIVGDYDVDGIMSSYILYKFISEKNKNTYYKIPHRVEDGYGINKNIINQAKDKNIDLIITCDNGISAFEPAAYAKDLGLDLIITDHHEPLVQNDIQKIPDALAVIDPKQEDCSYPYKNLCGAGVAFKLVDQTSRILNYEDGYVIREFLEFCAIATVCDVVPLIGENRTIAANGLKFLNNTANIGLKALIEAGQISDKTIEAYHLGFILGPMLNASGRLDTATMGLELLLEKDPIKAKKIADDLFRLNKNRQDLTDEALENVDRIIQSQNLYEDDIIVAYDGEVHESIAGIVAGRLKEKYYRPVIVLTKSKDIAKGSARSIDEYNMIENISKHAEDLISFGGHKLAAGLSLDLDKIDKFRREINQASTLTDDDLIEKVYIDLGLPINFINKDFINKLVDLSPFGVGNPRPSFGARDVSISDMQILGKNKNVIKGLASQNDQTYEVIGFNLVEDFANILEEDGLNLDDLIRSKRPVLCDIVYSPRINSFRGKETIQLNLESIRLGGK